MEKMLNAPQIKNKGRKNAQSTGLDLGMISGAKKNPTKRDRILLAFADKPKTAREVAVEVDESSRTIERYILKLYKQGLLWPCWVKLYDAVTRQPARTYSANKSRARNYFAQVSRDDWRHLAPNRQTDILNAIDAYFVDHKTEDTSTAHLSEELRPVWEKVKNTIEKEVLL